MTTNESITTQIKSRYGSIASDVRESQADDASGASASCCGDDCCGGTTLTEHVITRDLYSVDETAELPDAAVLASLGCGNPTALAELAPGETVLDLGSGGGIDVLLSARRVASTGKAYGLDMTDEMLALARDNQERAGVKNVEFLRGQIEDIPLPDASVDVVISNCVINLSTDKSKVLAEAFRVLRPGGRFAVSDIVFRGSAPASVRGKIDLWAGCISGALEESEYRDLLAGSGFEGIDVEPTRIYTAEDMREFAGELADTPADGVLMSAFVRARKPE